MPYWRGLRQFIHLVVRREPAVWVVVIASVLASGIILSWCFWGVLHDDQDSVSTTIRNLGFVVGGVVAILLAVWRSGYRKMLHGIGFAPFFYNFVTVGLRVIRRC